MTTSGRLAFAAGAFVAIGSLLGVGWMLRGERPAVTTDAARADPRDPAADESMHAVESEGAWINASRTPVAAEGGADPVEAARAEELVKTFLASVDAKDVEAMKPLFTPRIARRIQDRMGWTAYAASCRSAFDAMHPGTSARELGRRYVGGPDRGTVELALEEKPAGSLVVTRGPDGWRIDEW